MFLIDIRNPKNDTGAKQMIRFGIGLVAIWIAGISPGTAATSIDEIRPSADGGGPSHLFWLTTPSQLPNRDVIGIVDPLLAAIRLYSVERSAPNGKPIIERLESLGACALPIPFRPWRLLQMKNEVQIEGMPQPPAKNGHNANKADFQSSLYSVKRDLVTSGTLQALKDTGQNVDKPGWNPAAAFQCGTLSEKEVTTGQTAPFTARRAKNRPNRTIILKNTASSLTGTQTLTVRARTGGQYYLYSIRELEPAPSARVVQITEGVPTKDGMIRLNQRLLLFGKDGSKPFREISFDDTHVRSKIGHKPLAILPTGEVLAMGKQIGKKNPPFRIQSCGFVGALIAADKQQLCENEKDAVVAQRQDPDSAPAPDNTTPGKDEKDETATKAGESAKTIFGRVSDLATFSWSVDTSGLPNDCRSQSGCKVSKPNEPFVPLKGIRLSQGTYSQNGLPYAQTETFAGFDGFFEAFGRGRFETVAKGENRFSDALRNVKTTQKSLPGNLMDNFTGDLGIDCSALLQLAWNGRPDKSMDRVTTEVIQKRPLNYVCHNRLPDPSYLRSGDAIGISVPGAGEHIVLYAANVLFDGASEFWLVLESSSACDGVCWSVYDPSYFNGWALYRASNRADKKCLPPTQETSIKDSPFPSTVSEWREKVVKALPLKK